MPLLVLSACAPAPTTAPTTAPAAAPLDTIWYLSARARDAGRDVRRLADSLEYGWVVTTRNQRFDPASERTLPFRVVDSLLMTRAEFVAALRARTEPGEFAVLYAHGFGTSRPEAWKQAGHARIRSQGTQPWVAFTWPSGDSWLRWPRQGNFIATAYRLDSAMAVASRGAFLGALETVREAVGSSRLLLFTHSMGAQLAGETLVADTGLRAALTVDPLRAIAFHAADVDAARFGDVLVPALRPLARRMALYASSEDRALAAAGMLSDSDRAGRIERATGLPLRREGLESIDVTGGLSAAGTLRRLFGARHGIRYASAALFDLVQVVGAGRPASCRERLGIARRLAPTAWKLDARTLPSPVRVAACTETDSGQADGTGSTIASTAPAPPTSLLPLR